MIAFPEVSRDLLLCFFCNSTFEILENMKRKGEVLLKECKPKFNEPQELERSGLYRLSNSPFFWATWTVWVTQIHQFLKTSGDMGPNNDIDILFEASLVIINIESLLIRLTIQEGLYPALCSLVQPDTRLSP